MRTSAAPHAACNRYTAVVDYISASFCGTRCRKAGRDSVSRHVLRPWQIASVGFPFERTATKLLENTVLSYVFNFLSLNNNPSQSLACKY